MSTNMNVIEVHDPDFKSLLTIPLNCVVHVPPAYLDISRFVLCRNFSSKNPKTSCSMGNACKFVHAILDGHVVQQQEIHVNYAWKDEESVLYARLPAGDVLEVMGPNGRRPVELIPSELVLATKGAMSRSNHAGRLSHCAHYYFNRMCTRGDACNFIHAVFIDRNAQPHQRAPPRAGAGPVGQEYIARITEARAHDEVHEETQCEPSPRHQHSGSEGESCSFTGSGASTPRACESPSQRFRHNPYSLLCVTIPVSN